MSEKVCAEGCNNLVLHDYNLKLIQINGRKVLSPPEDWEGAPPTSACELFIRGIPKCMNDYDILQPFLKYGRIYEFRLPMDFNQKHRGYAYVKYATEMEATRAMEVLNHYYVTPGHCFDISRSYEKCRLFVTNIPKDIDNVDIENELRTIFPKLQYVSFKPTFMDETNGLKDNNTKNDQLQNRGYVFVQFSSHNDALESKRSVKPGLVRLWERDLKVVWAHPNVACISTFSQYKTLFACNVDLTINRNDLQQLVLRYVSRTDIRKISKIRNMAFFEFTTYQTAEWCLNQLRCCAIKGKSLCIQRLKPPKHSLNIDFDAVLRLKCIANNWGTPIIIFGCYYYQENVQYCTVILRNESDTISAIYCIMNVKDLIDIQSRLCELVCTLIETIGGFPDHNYVFLVEEETAHFLGIVKHNVYGMEFIASCGVPKQILFDWNELNAMSCAVASLVYTSEKTIYNAYSSSFSNQNEYSYIENWPLLPSHRIFGTITPKYRKKPALKYDLSNKQIILALCFKVTATNLLLTMNQSSQLFVVSAFDQRLEGINYLTIKLLPIALTQSHIASNYVMGYVVYPPNPNLIITSNYGTEENYAEALNN